MSVVEEHLISFELPVFLNSFKDKCLAYTIPLIDSSIDYVTKSDSSLFFILMLLVFLQVIRIALAKRPTQAKNVENSSQNRQMSKEIKDLKKELKSIQGMILQLKAIERPNHSSQSQISNSEEETRKLIQSCRSSWEKRESVASEILDWQLKIIKEVTKLKSKNKSSRSVSKIIFPKQPVTKHNF